MSQSFTFEIPTGSTMYNFNSEGLLAGQAQTSQPLSYTITKESDEGFRAGDIITITRPVGPAFEGIILGVTNTGVLFTRTDFQTGNYQYFTTDQSETFEDGEYIQFSTSPDSVFPVCFVRGTLVDTSHGPVAIENLQPGDQVLGSTGMRTVKWVGWRNYGPFALQTAEQKARSAPVRIRKHALADNVPSQDLLVSPWHHVYLDGVLVRAHDLINGTSIVQETHVTSVSYYHVELDQFDVISAYGVYSESWADGGNRDFFQNVDVTTLRPEDKQRRMADRPRFHVLRDKTEIATLRNSIAKRIVESQRDLPLANAA